MFQTENSVRIQGILSEINIKPGSFEKNGQKVETLGGNIRVKTSQVMNGEKVDLDIPVHMFSTKYKNDGGINPAYEAIERVMKEYKSIAAVGEEEADRIGVFVGSDKRKGDAIKMNEYYGANGQLIAFPRITANFISKLSKDNYTPEATFSMVFFIKSIAPEVDSEGIETGRIKVEGCPVTYGDKVELIPMYSVNEAVGSTIESRWSVGDTVRATGYLKFASETINRVEEQDFGEQTVRSFTRSISELLISGGSNPMEGDFALSKADIKKGFEERLQRLEVLKTRVNKKAPGKEGSVDDLGF